MNIIITHQDVLKVKGNILDKDKRVVQTMQVLGNTIEEIRDHLIKHGYSIKKDGLDKTSNVLFFSPKDT